MHDTEAAAGIWFSLFWIIFYIVIVYIFMNIVVAVVFEKLEQRSNLQNLSIEATGFDDVL